MSLIHQNHQKIINGSYLLKKRISSGSFGVVYLGQDIRTKEYLAVKMERQQGDEMSSVEREVVFLNTLQGIPQVPRVIWQGKDGSTSTMVVQLLGRDLTHYLKTLRKFSLKCVLIIADQMLTILENIHKRGILHRDIKPENVLVGRDREAQLLYVVDFGISKYYRDNKGTHILFKEGKPFMGTSRYASIAAHRGHELSRKDDLESLGYMLRLIIHEKPQGNLQWQNLNSVNDQDKIKQVGKMKIKLDSMEICTGLPLEFSRYLDYVRKLNFSSQPDYKYLLQLFKKLYSQSNFVSDNKFDWDIPSSNLSQPHRSSETYALQKRPVRRQSDDPTSLLVVACSRQRDVTPKQFSAEQEFATQSLLKPEIRKQSQISLSPVGRNSSRKQSASSFNESYSEKEGYPNGSIMVGFQASMMSVRSKQSGPLRQRFNSSALNEEVPQEQRYFSPPVKPQKKYSSIQMQSTSDQKFAHHQLRLFVQKQEDTSADLQQLNDDESHDLSQLLETKYSSLMKHQVKAHFKHTILILEKGLRKANREPRNTINR